MPKLQLAWPATTIKRSSYLRGRIGWQGLRASEFIDHGPFLITGTDFLDSGRIDWSRCYHVSEARFREGAYIQVRDGDILVTKDGTIGKVAYVRDCPGKAVLNSGVFLLRCSDGSYEHRFMYHLLRSDLFDTFLRLNLAGSTISHLYQYVFERFEFPTPERAIQQGTSEILSTVEEAIEQTEALIAKTQQIKTGLMQDLFTRGVAPNGQLRPPREEAPKLYKESPLGWIPKEWDIRLLADLCGADITYGIVQAGPHVEGGTPYIRTGDMAGDRLVRSDLLCTSPNIAAAYKRSEVRAGEIVCAIRATVGKVLSVPQELEGANLTQGTARISPKPFVNASFLLWSMRAARTQGWLSTQVKGTTFAEITLGNLRLLPIALPSTEEEQDVIAVRLGACAECIAAEGDVLAKLRRLKTGLMHDLLTGRIRVPVAESREVAI